MATISRFEDLEIWQLARQQANEIWLAYNEGPFAKDFELKNQINAASGSVMDNIAEGFERSGNKEFINFLRGRLRQTDKRKIVDKLLKLKLLSGKDHFVFFHNEFQNALPDDLDFRWFKSRMLISLRYNVEAITTLIFLRVKRL